MKKTASIWTCIVCLVAGGSLPLLGQQSISADRMIISEEVAEQDTLRMAGEIIVSEPSAAANSYSGYVQRREAISGMEDGQQVNAAPVHAEAEAEARVAQIWEEIDRPATSLQGPEDGKPISPWSFNTSVGTSFIAFPRYGSAMNIYAAPRVNFAANERLAFHAGMTIGRTLPFGGLVVAEDAISNGMTNSGMTNNGITNSGMTNNGITNFSGYVAASYLLTENLVIHGSGSRNAFLVPVDGQLQAVQFNDISVGATYNFGNFSIGATIHHSDAPVFGAPFGHGNNMYGAPLFW